MAVGKGQKRKRAAEKHGKEPETPHATKNESSLSELFMSKKAGIDDDLDGLFKNSVSAHHFLQFLLTNFRPVPL